MFDPNIVLQCTFSTLQLTYAGVGHPIIATHRIVLSITLKWTAEANILDITNILPVATVLPVVAMCPLALSWLTNARAVLSHDEAKSVHTGRAGSALVVG